MPPVFAFGYVVTSDTAFDFYHQIFTALDNWGVLRVLLIFGD